MGATMGAVPKWQEIQERVGKIQLEARNETRKKCLHAATNQNTGALYNLDITTDVLAECINCTSIAFASWSKNAVEVHPKL